MRVIILSILFIVSWEIAIGQVTFSEDPKITQLMASYTSTGLAQESIDGWRIKLVSTTDRRKFENTRDRFSSMFPDREFSSTYENPYYSLKTGAFESRFDLEPYLVQYKEEFPESIIYRDRILKTDLFDQ